MASIAVWEGVDMHQPVMKPHRNLVWRFCPARNPHFAVFAQVFEPRPDLVPGPPDVLVSCPKSTGPAPDFAEHPLVQFPNEGFIEDISRPGLLQPGNGINDISLLPLVKLLPPGDMLGDQALRFVMIEWGCTIRVILHRHLSLQKSGVRLRSSSATISARISSLPS